MTAARNVAEIDGAAPTTAPIALTSAVGVLSDPAGQR
jgi:hypothetical protein